MKIRTNLQGLRHSIGQRTPILSAKKLGKQIETHAFFAQTILTLLYRAAIDAIYVFVLSPVYAYNGFTVSIDPLFYVVTWAALLIFVPFCVELSNRRTSSSMLVTMMNYLFFIPMTCYCGCYGTSPIFFLIGLIYWGILLIFQFQIPMIRLKKPHVKYLSKLMVILTVVSCMTVMYISGRYAGFRLTVNIMDVYGIRAEAAAYDIPRIFFYALSMLPIVMSILLIYWLGKKRYMVAALIAIVYLFLFSISAQKSTFFFLLLVLLCCYLYRDWMLKWCTLVFMTAGLASVLEKVIVGTPYLLALFVNRVIILPVRICENYFNFFQDHPLNLFRSGIMGKLGFTELYSIGIPRVIGEFRGNVSENANGGLLADMFYNLPVIPGILILPLILIICFRLLDMTANTLPNKIKFPISLYFAIMFISGSWSTIVLSSGFLLACLLLYIYPNEEDTRREVP